MMRSDLWIVWFTPACALLMHVLCKYGLCVDVANETWTLTLHHDTIWHCNGVWMHPRELFIDVFIVKLLFVCCCDQWHMDDNHPSWYDLTFKWCVVAPHVLLTDVYIVIVPLMCWGDQLHTHNGTSTLIRFDIWMVCGWPPRVYYWLNVLQTNTHHTCTIACVCVAACKCKKKTQATTDTVCFVLHCKRLLDRFAVAQHQFTSACVCVAASNSNRTQNTTDITSFVLTYKCHVSDLRLHNINTQLHVYVMTQVNEKTHTTTTPTLWLLYLITHVI